MNADRNLAALRPPDRTVGVAPPPPPAGPKKAQRPSEAGVDEKGNRPPDKSRDKRSDKSRDKSGDKSPEKAEVVDVDLRDRDVDEHNGSPAPAAAVGGTSSSAAPRARASTAVLEEGAKYGTGIDIPLALYQQVRKTASQSRGRSTELTQTELVLAAFEKMYPRLPGLVEEHKRQGQVSSPLFGTRRVQVSDKTSPMRRLQIRPTFDEYQTLKDLAADYDVPLTVLTRLVLEEHFRTSS